MPTDGRVKWFDPKKGFGFIIGPDDQDVFVHYSQIQGEGFRSLKDGEQVTYELVEGDKGWQARDVHQLSLGGVLERDSPGPGTYGDAARVSELLVGRLFLDFGFFTSHQSCTRFRPTGSLPSFRSSRLPSCRFSAAKTPGRP